MKSKSLTILILLIFLAIPAAVYGTNFSYTTINSIRINDTVPVPNGWVYGNVSVYLSEGLEIVTYTESSDGLQVVLGIDAALLPDLGGTYLKVDASNDPVTGSLEVDEAVVAYKLKLVDDGGSGVDGEIEHVAGDITTDHTYTWPAPPGSTMYLRVAADGTISFGTPTGTAGGSDGQIQVNDSGNFAGIADGTAGYLLTTDGSHNYTWTAPVVDTNDKVKVTTNDTTANWLYDKITASTGISIAEINDGGDEDLQITCTVVDTDTNDKIAVSGTDTTPDYLMSKLTAITGLTWTQRGPGGVETLEGSVTADFSVISGNDVATDVSGAELEELTDGSVTTLHTHAGLPASIGPTAVAVGVIEIIDCGAVTTDALHSSVMVNCQTTNDGIVFPAVFSRSPVAGDVTYYWYVDGGDLKVSITNDSGLEINAMVWYQME